MLNIGMIGAGSISKAHLSAYAKYPETTVTAIADINEITAKTQAENFQIPRYFTDYRELLADESIDAVSIVTPTFTHCQVVKDALAAGKHVLCEKPPARTYKEALECVQAARESGKLLMWAFPCRFIKEIEFLKEYIAAGNMGNILHAEASRIFRCYSPGGWFRDKDKAGGGALIDGAIHELDQVLYLMDYPKVKSISGFTTHVNIDLPDKIKGVRMGYVSADKNKYETSVESMASGYVLFENGACLYVKASYVAHSVTKGTSFELIGEKAGARYQNQALELISSCGSYLTENKPVLSGEENIFEKEISHFAECCLGKAKPIGTPEQGAEIIKIIEGIYQSADQGKPILFDTL